MQDPNDVVLLTKLTDEIKALMDACQVDRHRVLGAVMAQAIHWENELGDLEEEADELEEDCDDDEEEEDFDDDDEDDCDDGDDGDDDWDSELDD